jgi:hypothetical protein
MNETSETTINPLPNDTKAASSESPISADNSPLILDWLAINTPESADSNSRRCFFADLVMSSTSLLLRENNEIKISAP